MWFNPRLFDIDECRDCGVPLPLGEILCWTCAQFQDSMKNKCAWCGDVIEDQNKWRWQQKGNACDDCDEFFDENVRESELR